MKNLFLGLVMLAGIGTSAQQSNKKIETLFAEYLTIKDALVTDNAAKASDAAGNFVQSLAAIDTKTIAVEKSNALKTDASAIQQSKDIKIQRKSFNSLSDNMVELMKDQKISSTIFVQYCPMAKAQWMSSKKEIRNPYYGKSMLECGFVSSEIK